MKRTARILGARLDSVNVHTGTCPSGLRFWTWFAILLTGCAHPVGWTHPTSGPGTPPGTIAAATSGTFNRWLPGARDINAANQQASQRAQQVPSDDPLSLRYMPKQVGPEVHVSAARLFEVQGKVDRAVTAYHEALKVRPDYEPALLGLARLYDRAGQWDQADQWYRRTLELHPQSAPAYNDWAVSLARRGQLPQAIPLWRQAVQHRPEEILYRNNLARGLVQVGSYEEAYSILASALPPAAAHYNMAYLLYESGRKDLAIVALQQSLQSDPNFQRARKLLAQWQTNDPQLVASHASHRAQTAHEPRPSTADGNSAPLVGQSPANMGPTLAPSGTYGSVQPPSATTHNVSLPSRYQTPSPLPR